GSLIGKLFILILVGSAIVISGAIAYYGGDENKASTKKLLPHIIMSLTLSFLIFFILGNYMLQIDMGLLWPILVGMITSALIIFIIDHLEIPGGKDNEGKIFFGSFLSLGLVLIFGLAILISNRLYGSYGIALLALGMLSPTLLLIPLNFIKPVLSAASDIMKKAADKKPLNLLLEGYKNSIFIVTVLLIGSSIAIARALMQIYLKATYLGVLGITVTDAYTFVGLILGILLPFIVLVFYSYSEKRELSSMGAAKILILLPLLIGFFIHIEPLGSFFMGSLGAVFVMSLLLICFKNIFFEKDDEPYARLFLKFALLLPILVIAQITLGSIAAPFFIAFINTTRLIRVIAFLVIALATLGAMMYLHKREG
ncbi:MAG: hypothetical protein V1843_01170, partial [bacterium]